MANNSPTLPLAAGLSTFRLIVQMSTNRHVAYLNTIKGDNVLPLQRICSFFEAATSGSLNSNTYITTNLAYASDLVTFSSIANGDTVTVNGRVYTAETSGATGLQQFNIGGSDTAAAKNFAAIINADTSTAVAGVVTAVPSAATITLYCLVPGNIGLRCTASISAHGTVASANFTGGSEGASGTIGHGL